MNINKYTISNGLVSFINSKLGAFFHSSGDISVKELNQSLIGYPRNHNYKIYNNKLLPSFRLYNRIKLVVSSYPEQLESFLDIGCCRGFFTMHAAGMPNCRTAAGIDVYEPFLSAARMVKKRLNIENANFYFATINDVANNPSAYGGPFQTILLLGAYHYLFWGSSLYPKAYNSHRKILSMLSRICSKKVIFSGRLDVERLPLDLKAKALSAGAGNIYNTARFLETAREFFKVYKAGSLGRYPLFVMFKKD